MKKHRQIIEPSYFFQAQVKITPETVDRRLFGHLETELLYKLWDYAQTLFEPYD